MEKINRAAEAFNKLKVDKLQENLILTEEWIGNIQTEFYKITRDLYNKIDELKKQRERFQHNLMYVEVIEDIINSKQTEWEDKIFNNMLVKLVGKDEVYKVFVQDKNTPSIGNKIKFIFNADENKLSNMKILE